MLYILWDLCAFILTVGILISIHELGHFITARLFGVTIQRFSIGFGYILWKYRDKKNTEYVISAIPLGGYVKMLKKHESVKIKNHTPTPLITFEEQTIWKRISIIAAGPIFNIIFAFIIYWLIFIIGISTYRPIIDNIIPNSILSHYNIPNHSEIKSINNVQTSDWESIRWKLFDTIVNNKEKHITMDITEINSLHNKKYSIDLTNWNYKIETQDIITAIGIIPVSKHIIKPIISQIQKHSPAMKAGLKIGDEIISINNQPINTWEQFIRYIKNSPNNINISVKRQNTILTLEIKPDIILNHDQTINKYIGISPTYFPISKEYIITYQFNPITAIKKSAEKIYELTYLTSKMLCKLISGNISFQNLGGPISIAKGAREATQYGIITYLMFLSLISINLGIINLLPLPILDGGYLLLLIIEKIIGKNQSEKIEKYTYHIGIFLIILLMCSTIFNDLSKLYHSK